MIAKRRQVSLTRGFRELTYPFVFTQQTHAMSVILLKMLQNSKTFVYHFQHHTAQHEAQPKQTNFCGGKTIERKTFLMSENINIAFYLWHTSSSAKLLLAFYDLYHFNRLTSSQSKHSREYQKSWEKCWKTNKQMNNFGKCLIFIINSSCSCWTYLAISYVVPPEKCKHAEVNRRSTAKRFNMF